MNDYDGDDFFRFLGDLAEDPVAHLKEARKAKKILIDQSVTAIPKGAFLKTDLEEVHFEEGSQLKTIGKESFKFTKIKTIRIPSSVKDIGEGAFMGDNNHNDFEEVHFEDNSQLETIGEYSFQETNIKTITIPSSVTKIGEEAFRRSDLKEVNFKEDSQLKTIGDGAFSKIDCSTISIPSSVREIGEWAFFSSKFQKFEFEKGSQLEIISVRAFYESEFTSICIPSSVKEIGKRAFHHSKFQKFEFEKGSQLEIVSKEAFISSKITTICIPSSVKEIGERAFFKSDVKKVEFESGSQLLEIRRHTFTGCEGLEAVLFDRQNSCLRKIEESAFEGCFRLYSMKLPFSVETIHGDAFQKCRFKPPYIVTKSMFDEYDGKPGDQRGLLSTTVTHVLVHRDAVHIPRRSMAYADSLKRLDLPPTLESIGESAFLNCNRLEFMEIPDSTTKIGDAYGIIQILMDESPIRKIVLLSRQSKLKNFGDSRDAKPIFVHKEECLSEQMHLLAYWGCSPDEGNDSLIDCMKSVLDQNANALKGDRDIDYMPVLHLYLKCGHSDLDVIKWMTDEYPQGFLNSDSERRVFSSESGLTALHIYLSRGHSDLNVIDWMVKEYPGVTLIRDNKGRFPIHCFCESQQTYHHFENHSAIVRLLSEGVSLLVPDKDGILPFSYALENSSWSALQTLYSYEPVLPFGESTGVISRLKREYCEDIKNMKEKSRPLSIMEQNGWVKFVSNHIYPGSPEANDIVDLIETCSDKETVKILAYAKTLNNLSALETAIPEIREAFQKRLLFLQRYEVNTSYVIHKSHTCIVLEARDANMDQYYKQIFEDRFGTESVNEEKFRSFLTYYGIVGDQEAKKYFDKIDLDESKTISKFEFLSFCKEYLGDKVVLKFMKNANQFQNEIESRGKLESDSKSVIGILRSHSPSKNANRGTQEGEVIDTTNNHNGDIKNEKEALDEKGATLGNGEVVKKKDHGTQNGKETETSKTFEEFLKTCTNNLTDVSDKDLKEHVQDIFNRLNKKSESLEMDSATSYKYIIVMVKGGKNLDSIFRSEQPGTNAIRGLAKEVGGALLSLHNRRIIHGDIKMLNIVRDENANRLKLIDLDASASISECITSKFSSGVLPPEAIRLIQKSEAKDMVLRNHLDDAEKEGSKKVALWDNLDKNAFIVKNVFYKDEIRTILKEERMKAENSIDVWAFGVLLYALCTGESLFAVNRDDDIVSFEAMKELYNWDRYKKGKLHRVDDPYARKLLEKILERNPLSRPNMKTILEDYFFHPSKVVDLEVVAKQLNRMEEKIDAVAEQIHSINDKLTQANHKISELLEATTPRLAFVDLTTSTTPKKAENWLESIKQNVKLHKEIKICFACPITYKIRTDDKGNKMGYVMKDPKEWVKVWGPRIVMTLKVSQFALSVGRMAGLPIPHFLDGIQEKFDSATEKFGTAGEILNDVMNEDLMKEFVGQNELFSTSMDLINHTTTIGEVVEKKTEQVTNSLQEAAKMEKPDKLKGLIKQSVEDVKKIAGDDVNFTKTGLIRTVANDGSVEFVHPDAETFFKKHGEKIFEMSVQEMLSKYQKHIDAEKLAENKARVAALEEEKKAAEEARVAEINRVNQEREDEIKRMNEEREAERKAWNKERAMMYKEREENKAASGCSCAVM